MERKKQTRREFLITGAAGIAAAQFMGLSSSVLAQGSFEIEEATVAGLQARMSSGEITSRKLVEIYLSRISEIDPKLHAVIEINPEAFAIADKLDGERKRGRIRSALHGIPVLIKDNIDTADKMKTTAGSLALLDAPAPKRDAFIVKKLREAGAIILGKTNLSEWANFRSTKSISGWSGRGGQTNNPYILDKNPCGSSAGSGVAVSANLCAIAIGTETNGSIICPASRNGVVGIKPTLGLVSRSGIIPIAHTQDTAGPMARTVADAAALLSVMVGRDKRDSVTSVASKNANDYAAFLDRDGLRGARIGVARQYFGNNAELKKLIEAQIEILREAGANLIEVNFAEDYSKLGDDRLNVLLYEFKTDLNLYLKNRGSKYKTLDDLIKFNEANKEKEMPLFAQELFVQSQEKGSLTDKAYLDSLAKVKTVTRENGIDLVVEKNKLDGIVSFASGATWSISAVAGYPYITVPAGMYEGLPFGLGFFGKAFTEPQLIKFAYAYEQKSEARRKPGFIPASK